MPLLKNLVRETANAPGTGTLTLNGAPAGWLTFAIAFGDATAAYYFIRDGAQAEWGVGVVHVGTSNTLSRDVVLGNSLGTTAHLNFAGAVDVYDALPAERSVWASQDDSQVLVSGGAGNRRVSGVAPATQPADAPRLDQVAYRDLSSVSIASSMPAASFSLPSGHVKYRLEWDFCVPVAAAAFYARFSVDGGTTYLAGASDYNSHSLTANTGSATPVSAGGLSPYLPLSETQSASFACRGFLDFSNVGQVQARFFGINSSSQLSEVWMGGYCNNTTKTNILVGFVGQNIAQGAFRLSGRI